MIRDYFHMYRARGLYKIWKYFCEAHLYDWINNIDTHYRYSNKTMSISRNSYPIEKKNIVAYQATWTSEIIKIFRATHQYFKKNSLSLKDYTFVDAGSGKGKVLIEWFNQTRKLKIKQNIIGVEINSVLYKIAKKNLVRSSFEKKINLTNRGILKYNFTKKKYIVYIFNSFSKSVLEKLIKKLKNKKFILIYNNPQFSLTTKKNNLKIIMAWKNKKFDNQKTDIYLNHILL